MSTAQVLQPITAEQILANPVGPGACLTSDQLTALVEQFRAFGIPNEGFQQDLREKAAAFEAAANGGEQPSWQDCFDAEASVHAGIDLLNSLAPEGWTLVDDEDLHWQSTITANEYTFTEDGKMDY